MRLRAAFWGSVGLTAFLFLSAIVVVGAPPRHASKEIIHQYAVRATIILPLLLLSFAAMGILAIFMLRLTRQEVLRETEENLKALIEGTLHDHRKRSGSDEPQP